MNPILKYFLTAGVRHLITVIFTLVIANHWLGADIAQKLMNGDTVTLWNGYAWNVSDIVTYAVAVFIPATILPLLLSTWSSIKSKFKQIVAAQKGTADKAVVQPVVRRATAKQIIREVAHAR